MAYGNNFGTLFGHSQKNLTVRQITRAASPFQSRVLLPATLANRPLLGPEQENRFILVCGKNLFTFINLC